MKENEASFEIFENILFVEMEISKLNNYLVENWWTCYSTMGTIDSLKFGQNPHENLSRYIRHLDTIKHSN